MEYDTRSIATIAERQHGIITTSQLLADGCSSEVIRGLARRGLLHRLHRGVYAVGHCALPQRATWMAAVLACGPGAVLGGIAAAQLWNITRRRDNVVTVVTPQPRRAHVGVDVTTSRELDRYRSRFDGIPVLAPVVVVAHLSGILTAPDLVNVMHEAAFRNLFDPRDMATYLDAHPRARGTATCRDALARFEAGEAGTRSSLEQRAARRMLASRLPLPRFNVTISAGGVPVEVDMLWPDSRVCVEVDGPGHDRPGTRATDDARDGLLTEAGYRVIRITAREIAGRPEPWIARIRAALGTRSTKPVAENGFVTR